jgi:hypothetical protein
MRIALKVKRIPTNASTRPPRKRAMAQGLPNKSEKAAIEADSTDSPRLVGSTWK